MGADGLIPVGEVWPKNSKSRSSLTKSTQQDWKSRSSNPLTSEDINQSKLSRDQYIANYCQISKTWLIRHVVVS